MEENTPALPPLNPMPPPLRKAHLIVMDSGAGGLNVLRTLLQAELDCPITFVADSAWMPYGDKPPSDLQERLLHLVGHVLNHRGYVNPYLLFACNTASAVWEGVNPALFGAHGIRPDRVIDILRPTLALLMRELLPERHSQTPVQVGLMATALTVESQVYPRLASMLFPLAGDDRLHWCNVPCYNLAQAVEGDASLEPVTVLLNRYVSVLKPLAPTAVILGCTHYLKLKADIQAELPDSMLIDPSEALVYVVRQRLGLPAIQCEFKPEGTYTIEQLELLETGTSSRLSDYCTREMPELKGIKFQSLHLNGK